jgi:hypothetical protein
MLTVLSKDAFLGTIKQSVFLPVSETPFMKFSVYSPEEIDICLPSEVSHSPDILYHRGAQIFQPVRSPLKMLEG